MDLEPFESEIRREADRYYDDLIETGMDPAEAFRDREELIREKRETIGRTLAVLAAARRYAVLIRDQPLDDGEGALRDRDEARAALLRAARQLVTIERASFEGE